MRKLEIGGGGHPTEGYEQLDILAGLSVQHYYPTGAPYLYFGPDLFDEVRAVHVLEHVVPQMVVLTLMEWRRITKPAGVMYVAVPNMEALCRAYIEHPEKRELIQTGIYGQDANPDARHKIGFDKGLLHLAVEQAGWKIAEEGVADDHHTTWWKEQGVPDLSIFVRATK